MMVGLRQDWPNDHTCEDYRSALKILQTKRRAAHMLLVNLWPALALRQAQIWLRFREARTDLGASPQWPMMAAMCA